MSEGQQDTADAVRPGGPEIRVIGVPRSGTNLAKYLIDLHSNATGRFNLGWWKHAPVPPLMDGRLARPDPYLTLVMIRSPARQMAALLRQSERSSAAISGARGIADFLSSPVRLSGFSGHELRFSSPLDYWISFHHTILTWTRGRVVVLDLDALCANPGLIARQLCAHQPDIVFHSEPRLPEQALAENRDVDFRTELRFRAPAGERAQPAPGSTTDSTDDLTREVRRLGGPELDDAFALYRRLKTLPPPAPPRRTGGTGARGHSSPSESNRAAGSLK